MKKDSNRPYKITLLILAAIIVLMALGVCAGCQRYPYTYCRNEVNLPFSADSLIKMTDTDLTQYLGEPTSNFDTTKSWFVYLNGQRLIIWQSPGEIEIIR